MCNFVDVVFVCFWLLAFCLVVCITVLVVWYLCLLYLCGITDYYLYIDLFVAWALICIVLMFLVC